MDVFSGTVSDCRTKIDIILQGLKDGESWAINCEYFYTKTFSDTLNSLISLVLATFGIRFGTFDEYTDTSGSFDECNSFRNEFVEGKYCNAKFYQDSTLR